MAESLFALENLFIISKNLWNIVENHINFKKTLEITINSIKNIIIDSNNSLWYLFRFIIKMMYYSNSIEILNKWEFLTQIKLICSQSLIENSQNILSCFEFNVYSDLIIECYLKFLNSKNLLIHQLAIINIKKIKNQISNFYKNLFQPLILPHIKFLALEGNKDKLPITLNLILEILFENEEFLLNTLNDVELHMLLIEHSPIIFTLYLSFDEIFNKYIDEMIEWWFDIGIFYYVKLFDISKELSFLKEIPLNIINKYPEILSPNNNIQFPPHLFSQLNKNKNSENKILIILNRIKILFETNSIIDLRAAILSISHYSSSINSLTNIKELNLLDILFKSTINSKSFIVLGTLIESLSLFYISDYFLEYLENINWQIFHFGNSYGIIPKNPFQLSFPDIPYELPLPNFNFNSFDQNLINIFFNFLNPFNNKNSKENLKKIFLEEKDNNKLIQMNQIGFKLINNYYFNNRSRKIILDLIKNKPLLNK